jgi:hypothetical protein
VVVGWSPEEDHPVTRTPSKAEWTVVVTAVCLALGWSSASAPDWYGILRGVMMVVGGLVVIALVLIVMVAVISGVMGMIGRLKKRG